MCSIIKYPGLRLRYSCLSHRNFPFLSEWIAFGGLSARSFRVNGRDSTIFENALFVRPLIFRTQGWSKTQFLRILLTVSHCSAMKRIPFNIKKITDHEGFELSHSVSVTRKLPLKTKRSRIGPKRNFTLLCKPTS